jgi:hypothetical protein
MIAKYTWMLVVAYDYDGHNRGDVISRHSTYGLAQKALHRHAFASFLRIAEAQ